MADDSSKSSSDLTKEYKQQYDLARALAKELAFATREIGKTTDQYRDLKSELLKTASTQEKVNKLTTMRGDLLKQAVETGKTINAQQIKALDNQIKGLKIIAEKEETEKRIADIQKGYTDQANALKDKMKGVLNTMSAIASDPAVAIGAALTFFASKAFEFGKAMFESFKSMGLGAGQTAQLAESTAMAATASEALGGSMNDAIGAAKALTAEAGALDNLTSEAVNNATFLSVRFGLGAETAAKLQTVMKDVAGGTLEGSESMQEFVTDLAIANNVAPGAVMADIAADTESFASFGKSGAEQFVKASIAAKKLGIEMSSITGAASNLLNLEDSISKQMEAEVYLGRQINLEAARQAAFQGDYLTLTKELTNQVGTLEEFTALSSVAQQSLADAVGLSVADTRKMITNQDKIADLSEEALEHYKETGEIQQQGESLLTAQNVQMGMQAASASAALVSLGSQLGLRTSIFGMAKATAEVDSGKTGGSKGGGGFMKMISNLNPMSLIKGAAAMVIVAGAVFVFGKAVQEFMKVSWEAVGMAVVSMLALTAAVAGLGFLMAGPGGAGVLVGAAAMVIVAGSIYILGKALQEMATAFDMMLPMTESLMGLVMIVPGLVALASTFGLLSVGIASMAASLLVLTPVLPALLALGSLAPVVGALTGNPTTEAPAASTSDSVIEKLDELITVVKAGGTINLDGRKVGDVLTLAKAPIGV